MKEKTFENNIIKWLHSKGVYKAGTHKQDMSAERTGWLFKMWGGGMGASGIPDLICCINGYFVAIEVKAAKGVPSKLQELNIQAINEGNGIAMMVYPKDFELMKKKIQEVLN